MPCPKQTNPTVILALALFLYSSSAIVAPLTWNDGPGGATRSHYNSAAKLPWDRAMGDWRDVSGEAWGHRPYTSIRLTPAVQGGSILVDVTELVSQWIQGKATNHGFYLVLNRNTLVVNSREAEEHRPKLTVSVNDAEHVMIAQMDTSLDGSTYKPLGKSHSLKISADTPGMIRFNLSSLSRNQKIGNATLQLFAKNIYGNGPFFLNVYRVDPAPNSRAIVPVKRGIAENFPNDIGIEKHPSVYMSSGFERSDWKTHWFIDGRAGSAGQHSSSPAYSPLSGNSLATIIPKDKNLGLNIRYKFAQNGFQEPEDAYFRYYLRLGDNWNQTISGGKLPGFAGTYKSAGWGSRRPNGSNGWSARGSFMRTIQPSDTNTSALTPVGSYVYHMDQDDYWGSTWSWSSGTAALLENNRWYSIEQYIKLNKPGSKDGIIKVWLDGRQVFEKTGLQFRATSKLKIEDVWFNIYHGGGAKSPRDQHAYIDNIVISREYVGPIKSSE